MHRLWHCVANVPFRRSLDDNCPGNCFPIGLPPCLARCGLIPANFEQRFGFSFCDVQAVLDYLSAVNESATLAISNSRSGKPIVLEPGARRRLEKDEIYNVALPPLKRIKRVSSIRLEGVSSDLGALVLPPQPSGLDWMPSVGSVLSCDGSCTGSDSGWGFTVARTASARLIDCCGPTVLDGLSTSFIDATQHSLPSLDR